MKGMINDDLVEVENMEAMGEVLSFPCH